MASPLTFSGYFSPEEIDFFARDELVTVVPNFSLPTPGSTVNCITGEFGPFAPNREAQVPLWLALALWKRRKCSIKAPEWMAGDYLQTVLELERQDPSSFQPLPFHYQELAHALFTGGVADALPREVFGDEAGRVRDLVNLVQKTRAAKVLAGLGMMTEAAAVKLNNLSAMELNSVRAFFCGALDQFHRCARIAEAGVGGGGGGGAAEAGGEGEGEGEKPARQLRRVRG